MATTNGSPNEITTVVNSKVEGEMMGMDILEFSENGQQCLGVMGF